MLTEARVVLPGAQPLLGFQLVVTLTRTFEQLPESSRLLHMAALCSVALTTILLMVPPTSNLVCRRERREFLARRLLVRDGGSGSARLRHSRRSIRRDYPGLWLGAARRSHGIGKLGGPCDILVRDPSVHSDRETATSSHT
jgi:hypothetical protein